MPPAPAAIAEGAGLPADPRSYTPTHLAKKILTCRSALEGERKQVTVLFADAAGFTGLAERLDPEAVHEIMDRCFRLLLEQVHQYEGSVNQFTGDGIMALFGAPIAHENAPERAIHAALGMQAALKRYGDELRRTHGIDFQMRIGVHTGPVVVGRIGDDLRMDYTAVGDTTNLAARLQSAAAPGAILISEQTAKLVAGRFATRPCGPLLLKGKSAPVAAHEVVRALPRAPLVARSEGGLTPLVGRAAELAALETIFGHVRAGRGQVTFLVGEAGIGKSRLLHEFNQRLQSEPVTWVTGRCISFGRGIPFLPIIDLLKNALGIEEGDDEARIIDKVHQVSATLGVEMQIAEPYLRALLAVDPGDPAISRMDASSRRFATFEALKRLMIAGAKRQPLVVLIEDLHWIDPASEEFLTYIADAVAGAAVLLLCTYRPGYRPALDDRSYATRLALQPLSANETAMMTAAMLETREFPGEIRSLVANKAEGNPFFIEEITKSLVEVGALRRSAEGYVLGRPVAEIIVPDTIQDVIMARIDRLGDEPKRAIQIASVIGREFAVRLLQRATQLGETVNGLIGELRALELIYEKSGVPELAYMFKHALTHDVAYESLLVQRRKQLHRTIGLAIEELYVDRLPEYWETLAHHFYRAEDWERALGYLIKAGDKARATFANAEAVLFYERALEAGAHVHADEATRAAILEGKGRAHFCLSEFLEAIQAYQEALRLVRAAPQRVRLQAALGSAFLWAHEFDAAVAAGNEALAGAGACANLEIVGDANFLLAFVAMVRGDLATSDRACSEVRRIATTTGSPLLHGQAGLYEGLRANWRGDYGAAIKTYDTLLAHLRDANELLLLAEAYSHFAITLGGAGVYDRFFALSAEGIDLAHSIGDKVWRARLWNTRGWVLGELGAYEAADEANRRCLEFMQQLGSLRFASEFVANAAANLADAALWRGDLAGAEPHLAQVAAILDDRRNEWMTWRYGMHYHASAAELLIARGEIGRARQHLERCLLTAQHTRSRRYVVRAQRLQAACSVAGGNLPQAEQILAAALADARALGNPPQLWQTLLAHGRVLHSLGRRVEAVAAWREALRLAETAAAALPADLQAALQASALGTTLRELGE